jgi:hypothetical protein
MMLQDALWALASASAKAFGFTFEIGCEMRMRGLIADGIANMPSSQPGQLPAAIAIQRAQENLVVFIAGMVYEARLTGQSTLHEATFFSVQSSLCPIWPFCK